MQLEIQLLLEGAGCYQIMERGSGGGVQGGEGGGYIRTKILELLHDISMCFSPLFSQYCSDLY